MTGDDDLLGVNEVCEYLAHLGRPIVPSTWRAHVATGRAPKPLDADGYQDRGHWRPRWRRSVVEQWAGKGDGQ